MRYFELYSTPSKSSVDEKIELTAKLTKDTTRKFFWQTTKSWQNKPNIHPASTTRSKTRSQRLWQRFKWCKKMLQRIWRSTLWSFRSMSPIRSKSIDSQPSRYWELLTPERERSLNKILRISHHTGVCSWPWGALTIGQARTASFLIFKKGSRCMPGRKHRDEKDPKASHSKNLDCKRKRLCLGV